MMYRVLQILKTLNTDFNDFLDQGDPRVENWPLMKNPFTSWVLIAAYIYFVKVAGPKWMHKKQPYELRLLMVFYNFVMVILNWQVFWAIGWYGYFDDYGLCQPVDYSNDYKASRIAEAGWLFLMLKYVEFTDTVFFVLRKKDNQISGLHVIHHSLVPFSLWFGVKFAPGGYNALFPFLNSFVHVLMYTYYGVAALGPQFQKYLFWKKYMTYIQMSQFIVVMAYALYLGATGCNMSKAFLFANATHAMLFLVLFYQFFRNSYGKKSKKSSDIHTNGKTGEWDFKSKVNGAPEILESGRKSKNGQAKRGKMVFLDTNQRKINCLNTVFNSPEKSSTLCRISEVSDGIRERNT